jgi:hypothetical protein
MRTVYIADTGVLFGVVVQITRNSNVSGERFAKLVCLS